MWKTIVKISNSGTIKARKNSIRIIIIFKSSLTLNSYQSNSSFKYVFILIFINLFLDQAPTVHLEQPQDMKVGEIKKIENKSEKFLTDKNEN
jgi:hypothetical protein